MPRVRVGRPPVLATYLQACDRVGTLGRLPNVIERPVATRLAPRYENVAVVSVFETTVWFTRQLDVQGVVSAESCRGRYEFLAAATRSAKAGASSRSPALPNAEPTANRRGQPAIRDQPPDLAPHHKCSVSSGDSSFSSEICPELLRSKSND